MSTSSTGPADAASLERLATGARWAEGPLWDPSTRRVLFSDIPNDRILAWDSATGDLLVHREGVEYINGRALDLSGRIVQCSHGRRSIEREEDGVPTTLADRFDGHRLNSPNDVVVASDGTIWFTDPPYGIQASGVEGHPGDEEYGGCFVFRLREDTGELTAVVTDMVHPNGLAFSPDERTLYVADTGSVDGTPLAHIRAYDVDLGTAVVSDGRVLLTVPDGVPDGFRVDVEGRIWTSAADGVHVYSADGAHLQAVPVPETVSNLCFGGDDGTDLYLTATTSLYRLRTSTTDAARHDVG